MEDSTSAGPADVVAAWQDDPETAARLAHIESIPSRAAIFEALSPPLPDPLRRALAERGIDRLYRHQANAIRRARRGDHTVVVAGTASGKSLCYQAPIVEAALADRRSTALLMFPTKALTQDQYRSLYALGIPEVSPAVYDGDTDRDTRAWVRRNANTVLTNPDMLHIGILPNHGRWATFLRGLKYVVVDEVHVLRGIFGSHVANVLRRLRRIAAHYGADPTFLACSATIGNPAELTSQLCGVDVGAVEQDTSPTGAKRYVLWNPEQDDDGGRRSALGEATDVFVDLVRSGHHTIAFSRSRKATELMYRWARDRLDPSLADRIAPYRGGYLAKERRQVEERLSSGDLLGVTATNALELGIDVGGLDAAVITTFPGTIASFRQQAGRAGRTLDESLAVLVAGEDALDQWYVTNPADLFGRPAEAAVVNPTNPEVLGAHAGCAAHELPLVPDDRAYFGEDLEEIAAHLVAAGDLVPRNGRLFWTRRARPAPGVGLRTSGAPPYSIVDDNGELLGTVDESRAFSQVHPGAVYLHQGEGHVVEELDTGLRTAVVRRGEPGWYTEPQVETWLDVVEITERSSVGRLPHRLGIVEVERHVVAFKRKSIRDRSVMGYEPLDLPPTRFSTQAFWWEVPDDLIEAAGVGGHRLAGTLHAAEHTAIAMLPLYAICDRWDIGGLSTPHHPEAGGAAWFIYDGYPGGAGIAPIGFAAGRRHLEATLAALRSCRCDEGCPSCVQSPKCGNFNEPLDKAGAIALLTTTLA